MIFLCKSYSKIYIQLNFFFHFFLMFHQASATAPMKHPMNTFQNIINDKQMDIYQATPFNSNSSPIYKNNFGYSFQNVPVDKNAVIGSFLQNFHFQHHGKCIILKSKNFRQPRILKKKSNEKVADPNISRKKFSPEEDEKLRNLVNEMGYIKWDEIAKEMPGRTGRQCRDRYKNYLVPGFFNGEWTKEEDEILCKKYLEYGSQWSKITQFFTNRNANSLKNRWNYFISKHLGDNKTINISNILLEVHEEKEKREKLEECSDIISNDNQSQSQSFFDISSDIDELDMQNNGFFDFKDDCSEFTDIF